MDAEQLYGAQGADEHGSYDLKLRDACVVDHLVTRVIKSSSAPPRIAELSVGDGRLSAALAALPGVGGLTCADISPRRLDAARNRIGATALPVEYVACNFDSDFDVLPGGSFDVVVALDILEHVFDVFGFLGHCGRLLNRGGALILRVPNIAYVRHRLRLLVGALPVTASWFGPAGGFDAWRSRWGWDGGHLHLFTIPAARQLLAEQGFVVEDCRDAGARYEPVRNLWPNLLYSNPMFFARQTR